MENNIREFILKMREVDTRLRYLYEQHEKYERELMAFGRRAFLTDDEQIKEKELKIAKLKGKEKLMEIVTELQSAA